MSSFRSFDRFLAHFIKTAITQPVFELGVWNFAWWYIWIIPKREDDNDDENDDDDGEHNDEDQHWPIFKSGGPDFAW